jgi:SpoVK/Ycf46/Vps4 family AAA+-type ATPase
LGMTPSDVETQLKKVLHRAERWGAILLIDEADVYIHARGNDMVQNAIVGVFLRVLEYYRGVLFMTTNRGTVIDDAIVSRLTARFRYENPNKDEQFKLWTVLSRENDIELDPVDIKHIVNSTVMPCVSGRDIKNLLKLALVSNLGRNHLKAGDIFKVVKFRHQMEA